MKNNVETNLPCVTQKPHSFNKGIGETNAFSEMPWNLLAEDISLPAAIVYESKLDNNVRWMQSFARQQGVELAPHGKTTMTPAFFEKQLSAGAWGITVATVPQAVVAGISGAKRILMANQLVGRRNMEVIAELADRHEFYCLLDSVENAHQLGLFFAEKNSRLNVLIEIGVEGGRCGCRSDDLVFEISQTVAQYDSLSLAGLEVYEGVIHGSGATDKIHSLLTRFTNLARTLMELNAFDHESIILTGAGSAWYDLVCCHLKRVSEEHNILALIRPGCYLIHDKGIYEQAQNDVIQRLEEKPPEGELESCLEVWAYVQSIPEPGRVIIGMGKRDVAFSDGLPQPALHYRLGNSRPQSAATDWKLVEIMDQHAFLQVPDNANIQVGDMIAFSTSHPCLTFDKWKNICLIDDNYQVSRVLDTYF